MEASPVELCHRRMLVFSVVSTLALGVEVGYARLVPKIPLLYAALLRAAVWDCVLVGVLVAQLVDLASSPLLAGTDGGHYLPLAVLLYHAMILTFCLMHDVISRGRGGRARSWHRSLVCRRVLLELAGGVSGSQLYLGRVCFVVSGGAMWVALRVLLWIDDGMNALTFFIILLLVAYCAAGLAALEVRHTLPGHLVQWLCTGWGAREAILQGPLKIFGGLFLLPFAMSVIAAQIWLRTLAFLVWLAAACPCCRLQRADNVYDAFERELAVPLLQCSFLAFASTLAAIVLGAGQLSSAQRMAVGAAAVYCTGMLTLWAAPAVLQAKLMAEESFEASSSLGEDGQARLLAGELRSETAEMSEIELEDVRATCEELRALLQRERHDHSVEAGQLQGKLRDQELRIRAADRDLAATKESAQRLSQEVQEWRERCSDLQQQLAERPRPALPRLQWPAAETEPGHALGEAGLGEVGRRRCVSDETSGNVDSVSPGDTSESDSSEQEGVFAAEHAGGPPSPPPVLPRPHDADAEAGGHAELVEAAGGGPAAAGRGREGLCGQGGAQAEAAADSAGPGPTSADDAEVPAVGVGEHSDPDLEELEGVTRTPSGEEAETSLDAEGSGNEPQSEERTS